MSGNASLGDINVRVGESFDVTLYSRPASTGFSWYLAYMPRGVVLLDARTEAVPPVMPGSQSRQVFTFIATAPVQKSLAFSLLRPWAPTEPADTRTYALIVQPAAGLQADLEKSAGSGSFVSAQGYRSHLPPILPYGFPDPGEMLQGSKGPVVHPLYGFPISRESGVNQMHSVVESSENCVVKYGFPWGVTTDADHCTLKYGFPVGHCKDENGVIPLYGFPRDLTADCGTPQAIRRDDDNCVVKYGTPGGVATDEGNCTLMYGVPVPHDQA